MNWNIFTEVPGEFLEIQINWCSVQAILRKRVIVSFRKSSTSSKKFKVFLARWSSDWTDWTMRSTTKSQVAFDGSRSKSSWFPHLGTLKIPYGGWGRSKKNRLMARCNIIRNTLGIVQRVCVEYSNNGLGSSFQTRRDACFLVCACSYPTIFVNTPNSEIGYYIFHLQSNKKILPFLHLAIDIFFHIPIQKITKDYTYYVQGPIRTTFNFTYRKSAR